MKHSKKLRLLAVPPSRHSPLDYGLKYIAIKNGISPGCLSAVISGRVNTKRLIEILEREWGESIEAIREIHQEHMDRLAVGNPITDEEAREWFAARQRKQ